MTEDQMYDEFLRPRASVLVFDSAAPKRRRVYAVKPVPGGKGLVVPKR